ncbi:MAG: hypothetical protein H6765_09475 [Candidatus Peribacteria bacterium]|nr:MAG: hypothetical protein H6765_09475 [Candidatus Peribacteria bacterium]
MEKLSQQPDYIVDEIPAVYSLQLGTKLLGTLKTFVARLVVLSEGEERNQLIRELVCKIEILKEARGLRHENIGYLVKDDHIDYFLQYIQDQAILLFIPEDN